jgi:hypothetical protein
MLTIILTITLLTLALTLTFTLTLILTLTLSLSLTLTLNLALTLTLTLVGDCAEADTAYNWVYEGKEEVHKYTCVYALVLSLAVVLWLSCGCLVVVLRLSYLVVVLSCGCLAFVLWLSCLVLSCLVLCQWSLAFVWSCRFVSVLCWRGHGLSLCVIICTSSWNIYRQLNLQVSMQICSSTPPAHNPSAEAVSLSLSPIQAWSCFRLVLSLSWDVILIVIFFFLLLLFFFYLSCLLSCCLVSCSLVKS